MPYRKLTVSQIRYLVAIYNNNTSEISLSEIAASLGVTKASAYKMVATMDRIGLVEKEIYGGITLTEKGRKIAGEIKEDYIKIVHFFVDDLKLDPDTANEDALNFISCMSEDLISKFMNRIYVEDEEMDINRYINKSYICFKDIKSYKGCYEVPFKLLKNDEKTVSMGNRALMHPCRIDISDKKATIMIGTKKITHKSLTGTYLSGRLSRLCYWNGEEFLDAEFEDNSFLIPIFDAESQGDELGVIRHSTLRLKIYASVGVFNMPASEAKLRLNFASRKKLHKEY
jgi:Mn-dependent DtxR family transcriptional regulator